MIQNMRDIYNIRHKSQLLVGLEAVEMATVPSGCELAVELSVAGLLSPLRRHFPEASGVLAEELTTKPGEALSVNKSVALRSLSFAPTDTDDGGEGSRVKSTDFLETELTILVLIVGVQLPPLAVGPLLNVSSGIGAGSVSPTESFVDIVSSTPSNGPQPKRAE
jgi:hypothetical protein